MALPKSNHQYIHRVAGIFIDREPKVLRGYAGKKFKSLNLSIVDSDGKRFNFHLSADMKDDLKLYSVENAYFRAFDTALNQKSAF